MTLNVRMPDRWFVRVDEKEYGPVDLETLREWQSEGRLLASNEVRGETDATWNSASAIPGLFAPPPLPQSAISTVQPLARRRTFFEIIRDSFRIYKSAFVPFFCVTLLISVPALAFELTSPVYGIFPHGPGATVLTPASFVALLAVTVLVVAWPIFLAAIQVASLQVLEGRKVRLRELLRRAINYFPRFARLSLIVYGSYFVWTAIPVLAALSLVSPTPSMGAFALAVLLVSVPLVMVARLFVNFLFWQQSAVVSNLEGAAAIRESKTMARSKRRPRMIERPLWRGALLASLWLLLVLGLASGAEVPFVFSKLQGVATPEQMLAILQNVNAPQTADARLITVAVVKSLLHALARPIFGIAFVLLYFDARTDFSDDELQSPPKSSSAPYREKLSR
jgi:GYF domain 2